MTFFARFSILLILPLLLLGGLGCKGGGVAPQTAQATKPLTLEYWTVFNDIDILRQFAAEYKAVRPYVSIDIRRLRYDEFDERFVNALADDVAPDIISVQNTAIGQYRSRLATMPPTVKMYAVQTSGGQFNKKTVIVPEVFALPTVRSLETGYVSTVAKDVSQDGAIYGLPLAVDTLAIYYNKDLLDRAGVALPPTTWDEFTAAVKKTTKYNSNGTIAQSGVALGTANNIDNAFDILSVLMMQQQTRMAVGNRIFFAEGVDGRDGAASPAIQALNFYVNFAREGVDYKSWDKTLPSAFESFVRGQSVFYIGYAFDRSRILAQAPQMNLEVIALPQLNPTRPTNLATYWVEGVVKKSTSQNEAWDFIRFITTPERIKRYTEKTSQPSPLRVQINDQLGSATISPFASAILFSENWYRGKNIDATKNAFRNLIEGEFKPLDPRQTEFERSANNLIQAARVVQQTM